MLENLVSIFSHMGATARVNVGVSITPNLGVEMIEVNISDSSISKYAFRQLNFDYTKREIVDYDLLREAIVELFEELNLSPKSNVVLNLPNVYFGITNLPQELPAEAINNAIISEVEQSYIFKRAEPIVSWCELGESNSQGKKIAFSAIQQNMLVEITEIFKALGTSLIAIETEPLSILKALDFAGFASNYMNMGKLWNLIIVNSVSYTIFELNGKQITNYYEEPLALKSFVDDEIYNAIITSATMTFNRNSLDAPEDESDDMPSSNNSSAPSFSSKDCLIVSETDLVSAEILSLKFPEDFNVHFIECNKYAEKELIPTELTVLPNNATKITLQAIGAGIYHKSSYPIKFNLLGMDLSNSVMVSDYPKIQFGNTEIELTPKFVRISMFIIALILVIPILLLMFIFEKLGQAEQNTCNALNSEIAKVQKELKEYGDAAKNNDFNLEMEIKEGIKKNKDKLVTYSMLGINLPPKLWIIHFNMDDKIKIEGGSKDIESIYTFYKNLKTMTNASDLRVKKLYMASDNQESKELEDVVPEEASFYKFVIANKDDPPPETDDKKNKDKDKNKK